MKKKKVTKSVTVEALGGETERSGLMKIQKSEQIPDNGIRTNQPLSRDYPPNTIESVVRESDILPQLCRVFATNVCGFGLQIKVKKGFDPEDNLVQAEMNKLEEELEGWSVFKQPKDIFQKAIEHREIYGYGFLEVIENPADKSIIEISYIEEPKSIDVYSKDDPQEFEYFYKGVLKKKKAKFRKFKQRIGTQSVYFKEFGDPRPMDKTTGRYDNVESPENLASSLVHFKLGFGAYGTPRWEGVSLPQQGSRESEELNYEYFSDGKHNPKMILVQGGSLTEASKDNLKQLGNDPRSNRFKYMVVEVSPEEAQSETEAAPDVKVSLEDLTDAIQSDALFQEYQSNNRAKAQSAFLLPDIYTAYSKDYNRATAMAIKENTEEQVFIPERQSLNFLINKVLLRNRYQYVELVFRSPNIENSDFHRAIFAVAAKGMTPNQIMAEYYEALNKGEYIAIDEDWANVPIAYYAKLANESAEETLVKIEKAIGDSKEQDMVSLSKEIKKALTDIKKSLSKE